MLEGQDTEMQVLELQLYFTVLIEDPCRLLAAQLLPLSYPLLQVMRKASIPQAECWNLYS